MSCIMRYKTQENALCETCDTSPNVKHLFCFVWIMLNGCNLRNVKWNWSLLWFIYCCELKLMLWLSASLYQHQCPAVQWLCFGWVISKKRICRMLITMLLWMVAVPMVKLNPVDWLMLYKCQTITHTQTCTHTYTHTPEVFCDWNCFWGLCLFIIWFFALSHKITFYRLLCYIALLFCSIQDNSTIQQFYQHSYLRKYCTDR